ncbi:putative glycosyltransferase At3g07620 [Primulina tabacum]|uniref:putative glycosyltransferase At3g07620 n=1 Tax=Primulina tabacum TaxID=48773 RepID=UPI003F5A8C45
MDNSIKISTLLQMEKRRWLFLVGLVALTHLFCQSLMLPDVNTLLSLFPDTKNNEFVKESESSKRSSGDMGIANDRHKVANQNLNSESQLVRKRKISNSYKVGGDTENEKELMEKDQEMKIKLSLDGTDMDDDFDFVEDETLDDEDIDTEELFVIHNDKLLQIGGGESRQNFSLARVVKGSSGNIIVDADTRKIDETTSNGGSNNTSLVLVKPATVSLNNSFDSKHMEFDARKANGSALDVSFDKSEKVSISQPAKKKMRCDMPPKTVTTIDEMERLLIRNRASSRASKPRWSSEHDQEILTAKFGIENAPAFKNDQELYAPLFRNISMFKRSYELMERVLKVYVYKEGEKPIFHQPILKGLYASEGWFMKLMEGNKNFEVKDPRKAHLFYMPFSSRMLEHSLYVRNSHNRTNLRRYLKNYSEKVAAKYRFWNRTGGADHFLVACHDWAPYETRHHMEHCIKALCNADVTTGFKIGRDVSLPETYIRSARNPLRDLGGKPPSQRTILAFYAGNMHGYLRPILLEFWKDKESDMKIFGPMPPGVASKRNYIQHMKSSKYCICPKGHEVNSPRVVEAIFYECVPVIISDNFVPPFFEVLNWDAFSFILAEKDIPDLKKILVSIPENKYLELQLGVRRVQQHFLWHQKPLKYDLFHMTLHSIWYNRVFQMKLR